MGCSQSSAAAAAAAETAANTQQNERRQQQPQTTTKQQQLPPYPYPQIEISNTIEEKIIGHKKKVQICSGTKRNWYPNKVKPNQDAYVQSNFIAPDGTSVHIFAVLDGHGGDGHKVSQWVAKQLPEEIENEFNKIKLDDNDGPTIDQGSVERACFNAHMNCQQKAISQLLLEQQQKKNNKTTTTTTTKDNKDNNDKEDKNNIIDFEWSGTTCVSIVVWVGGITICNVGDSRVIMGEFVTTKTNTTNTTNLQSSCNNNIMINGNNNGDETTTTTSKNNNKTKTTTKTTKTTTLFAAKALSHDHIPLRKDERRRIQSTCSNKARVITITQAAGHEPIDEIKNEQLWSKYDNDDDNDNNDNDNNNDNDQEDSNSKTTKKKKKKREEEERIYTDDPPRIFALDGMYPGYQFTRSFGDHSGLELGIIAEPEISTIKFSSSIGMIILATDGVYEYLTDQDVIDICALYNNPKDACESVIEIAYRNWIDKDVRTDDITLTCIYCNRSSSNENNNFDPLSLSMSIKNGTRVINEPSHDPKSGLPNFTNLTADCIKSYIKTGKISQRDFRKVGYSLRSNESFLFDSDDIDNNNNNNNNNNNDSKKKTNNESTLDMMATSANGDDDNDDNDHKKNNESTLDMMATAANGDDNDDDDDDNDHNNEEAAPTMD